MADDSLFLIDIDKILREKAPKKSKYIPKFVVSYLKHIVHQEELNVFLRESKDKVGVDFLKACLEFLDANIVVKGEENLPKEGLYTFVSNHPLGGQDGVALGYVLGSFYGGKVKYMVNDLLMNLHGLAPLCIPINKTGKQAKDFPRMVEAGFASDNQLIMFPAGLCSRRQYGNGIYQPCPECLYDSSDDCILQHSTGSFQTDLRTNCFKRLQKCPEDFSWISDLCGNRRWNRSTGVFIWGKIYYSEQSAECSTGIADLITNDFPFWNPGCIQRIFSGIP